MNRLFVQLKAWPWTQLLLVIILIIGVLNYLKTRAIESELQDVRGDLQTVSSRMLSLQLSQQMR
jgi:hypothetical protein